MSARLVHDARRIFDAALRAADPRIGILNALRVDGSTLTAAGQTWDLDSFHRIVVVGAGKASANMATAIEDLLGDRIAGGLINTKYGHLAELRRIRLNECGHPVPDEAGVRGSAEIADLCAAAGADDLIIVLISGGASALTPLPVTGVSLAEKQATTSLLLASGANIHEINAVRKHLSRFKGGQLARLAAPATVLALILSDVIGDDLDVIGSGPTAPDRSTFCDALRVLDKYGLRDRVPAAVRHHLEAGSPETPKPGDDAFSRVCNVVVGSNRIAMNAAAEQARALGYSTLCLSASIEGETREVAGVHAAILREIDASGQPLPRPACILSGGETTVTLKGSGKGGRNQEFALAAALGIAGLRDVVALSAGTDGTDGPTDAAGAVVTGCSLNGRADEARRALAENDSYHFFEGSGELILTGPTGTNVADIRVLLAGAQES